MYKLPNEKIILPKMEPKLSSFPEVIYICGPKLHFRILWYIVSGFLPSKFSFEAFTVQLL